MFLSFIQYEFLDVCMTKQCYNGGSCVIEDNGKPICTCIQGYWGDNCEQSKYYSILALCPIRKFKLFYL